MNGILRKFDLPAHVEQTLRQCRQICTPRTKEELYQLCFGPNNSDRFDVIYYVNGKPVKEADVVRCKNGAVVNYPEDYMRRRDPDCMRIGDELPTDKPRFSDIYGEPFAGIKQETMDWLADQDLLVLPFLSGGKNYGYGSLLICPMNAAFFAKALTDIQGFLNIDEMEGFRPRAIIYVAPPFRHTHFNGKQVVVHERSAELHEVFAYNLYPGPSAKKGVYSVLLDIGEQEGWVTAHASAVRVVTPYENETVIMHEGASGGGKSEMLEEIHRVDGKRVLLGTHLETGEKYYVSMQDTCSLQPVTDDMALCPLSLQNSSGKLVCTDAEEGWFLRMDNMVSYGCDQTYERICIHPKEPLIFFSMEGAPNSTCLIWEHAMDSNGKLCPNPRAIVPRDSVPNIVREPVEVDVRSFGVRMPPSTRKNPTYGIMGLLHIVPPALGWLWRLVAPRGHKNPSIADGNSAAMCSEGVGSYWPFATGCKVTQANLLLKQIMNAPQTRFVLIPNQHIGAYEVGFAPEWIAREFLARHGGAKLKPRHLTPARCSLFGYALSELVIDGQSIRQTFLRPETQSRLGTDGYDQGAKILNDFFQKELRQYLTDELDPLGRAIIECCLQNGALEDYCKLTPMDL